MLVVLFKGISIQSQFLTFEEKSIFYAKITLSQKNFASKHSFKHSASLFFRRSNNATEYNVTTSSHYAQ